MTHQFSKAGLIHHLTDLERREHGYRALLHSKRELTSWSMDELRRTHDGFHSTLPLPDYETGRVGRVADY